MIRRRFVVACSAAALTAGGTIAVPVAVAAVSATIPIVIGPAMTLSTSTVEVEFPVTVTCDNIGAFDSYVYVHLQQDQTGATGSGEVRPLICDSTPHQYMVHVFADALVFHDGMATASSVAQNIGPNFMEQDGSATTSTTLVLGKVDAPATSITSPTSGSTYTVDFGNKGTLFGKIVNGDGYAQAMIPVTVTCTPPTTSASAWISVDVEAPNGQSVKTGSNSFGTVSDPQLVCDGAPHSYVFTVFAQGDTPNGFSSGQASAAAYIESQYGSPQWPVAPVNADAVATIHFA